MIFWVAVLAGTGLAWLAVRMKFYATWVLCFNVLLSVYLSIFLTPTVANFAPMEGTAASYGTALTMMIVACGCFAILHGLSYVFLTGQFTISFPRLFDILLSGLLGFIAGFLILSFAAIVFTTTPLARHKIVGSIGFSQRSQQSTVLCLAKCCDLVHAVAGSGSSADTTKAAIDRLLTIKPKDSEPKPDANEPPAGPVKSPTRAPVKRRTIVDPGGE